MIQYLPKKIFVDENVVNNVFTKNILKFYNDIDFEIVSSDKEFEKLYKGAKDPILEAKKYLYLTENKGSFLKKCPGTNGFVCCNYYVIDLIENCHFECHYCFLQSYLNKPIIKIYVNLEKLFSELDKLIVDDKRLYRIGTGELSDSLALDSITGFSEVLVNYFSNKSNALLELKTKSNQVQRLLKLDSKGRVVVSWSVNPAEFIEKHEEKTASLDERLDSAKKCMDAGYQIGFHFDPIVHYSNWENGYSDLIKQIFTKLESSSIAWISMGSLRYSKDLKEVMKQRFHKPDILYDEFLKNSDGKFRYFLKIREKLFTKLKSIILSYDPKMMIYLCMEAKHMWKRVYSIEDGKRIQLDTLFKKRQTEIVLNNKNKLKLNNLDDTIINNSEKTLLNY